MSKCPAGLVSVPYEDLTICVTPDYYMEDGIRVPVDLRRAHEIARERGMILPTTGMVDAIWRHADVKLSPRPLNPSNTGNPNFYNGGAGGIADPKWVPFHNEMVEEQLRAAGATPGQLIAGHKKDIVAHDANSSRIAIYGWHQSNGRPIQPRSTVHGWSYKDYSQGLRLVSEIAFDKDGNPVKLSF
jgi:hypothetical protein